VNARDSSRPTPLKSLSWSIPDPLCSNSCNSPFVFPGAKWVSIVAHDLLGARDGLRQGLDPHPADHGVEGNEFLNDWFVANNGFAVCLRCRGNELLVEIVSPRHFAGELTFPRLRTLAQPGRDA